MKKMLLMAVMMVMTISANAMSYNAARNEALFLSDKMAYELNLTAAQYEAVYEINLDCTWRSCPRQERQSGHQRYCRERCPTYRH